MKIQKSIGLLLLVLFGSSKAFAQPYSLDKKLEPIKLALEADTRSGHEGEKGIVYFNQLDSTAMLHYVSGHNMFQMVDVLVSSMDDTPLKVTLVKDNWDDVQEQKNTSSVPDGIVNFKVRAYGSFGIKVEADEADHSPYNIVVLASKPVKEYLGSPFRKIKESEMKAAKAAETPETFGSGGDNKWLYIAMGVALLVIGLLAGKLLGKNKNSATLVLLLMGIPSMAFAQPSPQGSFLTVEEFEDYVKDTEAHFKDFETLLKVISERVPSEWNAEKFKKTTGNIDQKITGIMKAWSSAAKVFSLYNGLGGCMNAETCSECYYQARTEFNNVRYTLEELATIYSCTKKFTDAALAFGDNASGIHGVIGLAWQNERRGIEKSISDLEKAYDAKYSELMKRLAEAMQQLNICEAKYGVEDWYDRFGFIYFEFMKDKYKRG